MRVVTSLTLALALAAASCGGASTPPPAVASAPTSLASLRILVADKAALRGERADEHQGLESEVPDALADALTKAGFQVVTSPDAPHDLVAHAYVTVTK